jgi:hypothetical protein
MWLFDNDHEVDTIEVDGPTSTRERPGLATEAYPNFTLWSCDLVSQAKLLFDRPMLSLLRIGQYSITMYDIFARSFPDLHTLFVDIVCSTGRDRYLEHQNLVVKAKAAFIGIR